jgi:hypothetical protein
LRLDALGDDGDVLNARDLGERQNERSAPPGKAWLHL